MPWVQIPLCPSLVVSFMWPQLRPGLDLITYKGWGSGQACWRLKPYTSASPNYGMAQEPLTVWNEITISQSGIGITLYSESTDGAVVEDETWFTFDELQTETGEIHSLNLSDETDELMAEAAKTLRQQKAIDSIEENINESDVINKSDEEQESHDFPNEGEIVEDLNPPSWSENNALEVVEVLEDVKAEDYVIQGQRAGVALSEDEHLSLYEQSVAQANPSYDSDDPVVLCEYVDENNNTTYAFPLGRIAR